ncbi:MAG TPA: preprotein translocase subunit SecG [Spirochaetaceae bacterium]|nr:preprotein translocase subunit SecG [Spirochaetaceae bacterium]
MSVLSLILVIVFIVVSVLLILLVSIQDEKQSGLAGIFGGTGGSAFGAQTASVVVKTTTVLSVLFFALALSLAFTSKGSLKKDDVLREYERTQVENAAPASQDATADSSSVSETI